ncbi:MAG: gamma-glutamyltransferase [Alkalilacustris sp.]
MPRPPAATRIAASLLVAVMLAAPLAAGTADPAALDQDLPEGASGHAPRAAVTAERRMVVAAHPLAADAGYAVLAAGGTAADAAVAVQAMLTLVEPQSSGLGGGGFVLHWDAAAGTLTSYDGRERAPLAAGPDYWLDDDGAPLAFWDAVVGGRSVGVPGTPRLLETLHDRHGRLDWAALLAPAIATAEAGFEVSPRLARAIAEARALDRFEPARSYFFDDAGAPLTAGTRLRNPDLAATLRRLAEDGAEVFYTGPIARDILAAVRTDINPGLLSPEDLASYRVIPRAPVCIDYRAHQVCGMGPPSSGGLTVGQILGMLEGFDLAALGPGIEATHLMLEASRLAFADRALFMADADFTDMPEGLLNRPYLAERAALIDPAAAMADAPAGAPPWRDARARAPDPGADRRGTTHFVIVDDAGNMVSATTTIEAGFGSRVMTGGFLLNNELTDFARAPMADGRPVANRVEGGKRPRSSMAPTVVLRDGQPVALTGSPGGAAIIGYTVQSLVALLDWGLDAQAATELPHAVTFGGPVILEDTPGAAERARALEALGHEVTLRDLTSGLHIITRGPDGRLTGGADPRREGRALGD